jgi:hypothetical protein
MIVVKSKFHTSAFTITRPLGQTVIPKSSSWIYSSSTDFSNLGGVANPYQISAEKTFERDAINAYAAKGGFTLVSGRVYYTKLDSTDQSKYFSDWDRDEHLKYAKDNMADQITLDKAKHLAAEHEAGRTGKKRPDGSKAPEPTKLDLKKYKLLDYFENEEIKACEERFIAFRKDDPSLDAAREKKKQTLAKHTTYLGPALDVAQKEATALRGAPPNLVSQMVIKAITEALKGDPIIAPGDEALTHASEQEPDDPESDESDHED